MVLFFHEHSICWDGSSSELNVSLSHKIKCSECDGRIYKYVFFNSLQRCLFRQKKWSSNVRCVDPIHIGITGVNTKNVRPIEPVLV